MKSLESLRRLHRWRVDEKRRKVADLERLKSEIESRMARLDSQLAREGELTDASAEVRHVFPAYATAALQQRKTLERSLAGVVEAIAAARDELTEAFREAKKYDLLAENRAKRERTAIARRLRQELDEIGGEGHRRRSRES